jgi:hypothetical protein
MTLSFLPFLPPADLPIIPSLPQFPFISSLFPLQTVSITVSVIVTVTSTYIHTYSTEERRFPLGLFCSPSSRRSSLICLPDSDWLPSPPSPAVCPTLSLHSRLEPLLTMSLSQSIKNLVRHGPSCSSLTLDPPSLPPSPAKPRGPHCSVMSRSLTTPRRKARPHNTPPRRPHDPGLAGECPPAPAEPARPDRSR